MTDPVSATAAVLTSFAHTNNLLKAILGVRDTVVNLEQVNELLAEINSIQAGYFSLLQQNTSMLGEIDNLKKEITRFETWENEAKRYKLTKIQTGVFAYALKEADADGEPPHWICADCYNKRKKLILSKSREEYRDKKYKCTDCGFSASVHDNHVPEYV